jgi:hypothetical protein
MPSDICAKAIRFYGGAKYSITTIPGGQEVAFLGGARFMTLTPRIFDFDLCARPSDEASINIEVVNLTCSNGFGGFPGIGREKLRIMNDSMTAASSHHPNRISWLALPSWQHTQHIGK